MPQLTGCPTAILCLWCYTVPAVLPSASGYPAPTVPPHVQCAKLVPICPGVTPTHVFPTAGLENLELLVHPPRIEHPITIQRPNVDYREVQGKQG